MGFTSRIKQVMRSLYPPAYEGLSSEPLPSLLKYLGFVLVFAIIVQILLYIPALYFGIADFETRVQEVEQFSITIDYGQSDPLVLINQPRIVINNAATGLGNEWMLITEDDLMYRSFFGIEKIPLSLLEDLTNPDSPLPMFLMLLGIALLPAVIVGSLIFVLLKTIIIIYTTCFLLWLVYKLTSYALSWKQLLGVGIYASTWLILLEIGLFPLWRFNWWPFLIYVILLLLGSWFAAKRNFHVGKPKRKV